MSTAIDLSTFEGFISSLNDREALAAVLLRQDYGVDVQSLKMYRSRHMNGASGRDYWGEALSTADVVMAAGFNRASVIDGRALNESLGTAEGWSEHGYTDGSKSYWTGMRDTIRVVLGITTEVPTGSASDAAAFTILGAQGRLNRKG